MVNACVATYDIGFFILSEDAIKTDRYKQAGVDIDAGNALVEAIKPLARATARRGIDGSLGGFGGLIDLAATGFKDPILVATTDGVGTKLKIALDINRHDTIGIDLVAMCVNDLIVQGAEPLFFLDYFAVGRLDPQRGQQIIAGIAKACRECGCALVGGETAEMPGLYKDDDYDLAGFAVGAVERDQILPRLQSINPGDIVLGLASSGAHANGFSLIRRIVAESGLTYDSAAPFSSDQTLGEALLTPTRLYVRGPLAAARQGWVKAFAHITGGGLLENIPRVLPDQVAAQIQRSAWQRPALFDWLATQGHVPEPEMHRVFNCGIGLIAIVAPQHVDQAEACFRDHGDTVHRIGTIIPRTLSPTDNHNESVLLVP